MQMLALLLYFASQLSTYCNASYILGVIQLAEISPAHNTLTGVHEYQIYA